MADTPAQLLVVDDDPIIQDVLREVLSDAGHAVTTADTGLGALDAARRAPIDLVVLDIRLPDIDGLEACRRLRQEHGSALAILLLSANDRRTAVPGLAAGADDYLSKPFDTDELLARVDALLRMHAAEASARRLADRLLGLQRISAAMLAQLDEDRVIELVLTEVRRLLAASGVALYQWEPEREVLRPRHVVAPGMAAPAGERRRGEGTVGQAFDRGEPVWINDYSAWEGAPDDSRGVGVTAAVAAPLILGAETLGVISARKVGPAARFGDEDARLLGLLAAPAAVALNNARLYAAQRVAAERAAERAAQPPPAQRPKPRRKAGPSRRIMIVDDEAPLVGMLSRLLTAEGHEVTACTSGAEALARFDPARHDVVITDLGMADVNGLQVAATLHTRSPGTPVILATGWGNELDRENPPPGVAKILAKPYRVAVVLDAISAVLANAGSSADQQAARTDSQVRAR